ncbi:hypothetical protein KDA82_39485, partial [Streptomyces daliensis]|nr:hypothetical protein [Streptomyces daliensis]
MAVLTQDDGSMAQSVRTIERLAHAVNRNLHSGRKQERRGYTPHGSIDRTPDGSVPADTADTA